MIEKEKLFEMVTKLNKAIVTTNSSFVGDAQLGILSDGTYYVSLSHMDNRYKNKANFLMVFDHYEEKQMNDKLLLALDVINYNRLIKEEKSI